MRTCELCGEPIVTGERAMHRFEGFETESGELSHVERDVLRAVHTRCYLAADPGEIDELLDARRRGRLPADGLIAMSTLALHARRKVRDVQAIRLATGTETRYNGGTPTPRHKSGPRECSRTPEAVAAAPRTPTT